MLNLLEILHKTENLRSTEVLCCFQTKKGMAGIFSNFLNKLYKSIVYILKANSTINSKLTSRFFKLICNGSIKDTF